ncbi:hypothetical protein Vi05172_g3027 [Venturia inaequalis]|nr:hypothetical protein Vi05172_g3027 [Venturia inaequalis]
MQQRTAVVTAQGERQDADTHWPTLGLALVTHPDRPQSLRRIGNAERKPSRPTTPTTHFSSKALPIRSSTTSSKCQKIYCDP